MLKRITATALAASIALTTAFSAPARAADSGEIARTILGAGVLLYLGNELARQNNRGHVTRRYVEPRYYDRDRDHRDYRRGGHRKVVPSACLRGHGRDRYVGAHCLSQNMRQAGRLPDNCRISVQTNRGWRSGYAAGCLRRNGWTFG